MLRIDTRDQGWHVRVARAAMAQEYMAAGSSRAGLNLYSATFLPSRKSLEYNGKPFPVTKWKISDAEVCVRNVELLLIVGKLLLTFCL